MILRKEPVRYNGIVGMLTIYHTTIKDMFTGEKDRYEVVIESPVYHHDSGLIKAKDVPILCSLYRRAFQKFIDKRNQGRTAVKHWWNKLFS